MVQINPNYFRKELPRNPATAVMSMIRSSLEKVFDTKTLKVKLEDDVLNKILTSLEDLNKKKETIQLGKPELRLENLAVNNLDSLSLENINKLSLDIAQLNSIIKLLRDGQQLDSNTISILTKIFNVIGQLAKKDVVFPSVQKVEGEVSISNIKENRQLYDLNKTMNQVRAAIEALKPSEKTGAIDFSSVTKKLDDVVAQLKKLPELMPEMAREVRVSNFPIQKYPMPVTNININGLGGFTKSRAITVSTSLTPLPDEVLANRRSLIVFNNSAATTIYIGGSDVTSSNGLPVLAQTYSPAIDAGSKLIVYAVTASSTADVRVLEASHDAVGR
jgi:hypothetical protein